MYVPLHLLLNTRWTCIGCARSLLGSLQWWYHNLYAHWMSLTFTKMSQSMHNRIEWRAKTEFNSILSPMRDRCNSCDATIIPIASVGYSKCERNLISNPLKTEKKTSTSIIRCALIVSIFGRATHIRSYSLQSNWAAEYFCSSVRFDFVQRAIT